MPPALSRRTVLVALAALTALGLVHSLGSGFNGADEAWFLRVCERIADGDVLYRDVFYGATPLAPWLGAALVSLLGTELLVVKLLCAAALAGSAIAAACVLARLGAGRIPALALAVVIVVTPGLAGDSLYTTLSVTWAMASLAALLAWQQGRGTRALVLAGVCVGLCWATKQNLGTAGLGALAVSVVLFGGRLREVCLAVGCAVATIGASLVAIGLTGGWSRFVEYGFTAKGTYLDRAGISVFDGVRSLATHSGELLRDPGVHRLEIVAAEAGYPMLAAAVIAIGVAWWIDVGRRREIAVVGLFLLVVATTLYPRADVPHVVPTLPASLLAVAVAAHVLVRAHAVRRALVVAAIGWAAAVAGSFMAVHGAGLADGSERLGSFAPLHGVVVGAPTLDDLRTQRARLRTLAKADRPVLMLGSGAALGQLLGDLPSPTPYDYPLVTAFGHDGQRRTADRVRAGDFGSACITPSYSGLEATLLEAAVRATFRRQRDIGYCRLYE